MARALPSQLATLLNTLRLVDAVNHLLARRVVEVTEGEDGNLSADYDELMAWGDKALQARFAGATQYLKAAKSFGLVHYGGEMTAFLPKAATFQRRVSTDTKKSASTEKEPSHVELRTEHVACRVRSLSLWCTRHELLVRALCKPHRVVPAMFAEAMDETASNEWSRDAARERLMRLVLCVEPFRSRTAEFLRSSFEAELRECVFLLEDELWASDDELDEGDVDLKRAADKAAVDRVLDARDFFDVLSLPRECEALAIKKAFLKLSKEVHPDKNGAKRAAEAFDRLNTAKLTLLDPEERETYVSLHPPRAAVAREWARAMDGGGKAKWERANTAQFHRSRG